MLVHRLATIVLVLSFVARAPAQRPGDFDFDSLPEKTPSADFVARLFEHVKRPPLSTEMLEQTTWRLASANDASFPFLSRRIADPWFLKEMDRLHEEFEHHKASPLELVEAAIRSNGELFDSSAVRELLRNVVGRRGFVVGGKVVDASNLPVAEAFVVEHRRGRMTRTNAKGEFRFDSLAGGTQIWVSAWRDDYCSIVEWVLPNSNQGPLVLKLLPEVQRVGRVVDPRGTPVENCGINLLVSVESSNTPFGASGLPFCNEVLTSTDANGVFRLLHHPVGAKVVNLSAWHPSFQPKTCPAPFGDDANKQVEISLARGCAISGKVVDVVGKPLADAVVKRKMLSGYVEAKRITGPDGAFAFADAAPGEYIITAEHRSFARGYEKVVAVENKPVVGLKVAVVPGEPIEGTVVDAKGKPLSGVEIGPLVPVDSSGGRNGPLVLGGCWTNNEGGFRLGPLPTDETFHVFINERRVSTVRADRRELRIVLPLNSRRVK